MRFEVIADSELSSCAAKVKAVRTAADLLTQMNVSVMARGMCLVRVMGVFVSEKDMKSLVAIDCYCLASPGDLVVGKPCAM